MEGILPCCSGALSREGFDDEKFKLRNALQVKRTEISPERGKRFKNSKFRRARVF